MPLGAAALHELARTRVESTLHDAVERLVGEHDHPVARDAFVGGEEELVEPSPVEHLGECHPGTTEGRPRQRSDAPEGVRLVREVEEGRVE